MRTSKFSESQRREIVSRYQNGEAVESLCRAHQISPATLYNWQRALEDQKDDDKRRLRELEAENARLKKMYAELRIDHEILQEGYEMAKKFAAQNKGKK
jgi:putative transposase